MILWVTYIFCHLSLSKNYDCLSFFITRKKVSFAKTTVNDDSVLEQTLGNQTPSTALQSVLVPRPVEGAQKILQACF